MGLKYYIKVIVNLKITPEVIKKRIENEKAKRPLIKDLDISGVLEKLKSTHNISYTILTPNKNGIVNPNDITRNIQSNTYLV